MTEIKIDPDLAESARDQIKDTSFESLEEYINFILEETVQRKVRKSIDDQDTERDVEDQLEDLGYL